MPFIYKHNTIGPPLPAPVPYSSDTLVDFDEARGQLEALGLELAYNKIGFHTGPNEYADGIGLVWDALDEAGVPIILKSTDHAGPIWEVQELAKASGVQHVLIFRLTEGGQGDGYNYDIPDYSLPAAEAAELHWQKHLAKFPPELDPEYVWLETMNELDKTKSEWLGQFALETAQKALNDGYRWAAFGWSTGEPEEYHWEAPSVLEFLRLAGENPDRLAIALHEYSLSVDEIGRDYPYLLGRFQKLFEVCDRYGIPRPTVLITEWGWEADDVPSPEPAMEDIAWAAQLYAAYPEVKGAAIWYLGGGDIRFDTQKLIAPVGDYTLHNYFGITPGQGRIDPSVIQPQTDPLIARQ